SNLHHLLLAHARKLRKLIGHIGAALVGEEDHANDKSDGSNSDRIQQTDIGITIRWIAHPARLVETCRDEWRKSAKDPVADIIWQRHGRVSNAGWEEFDEERCDRPIHHSYEYDLNKYQQHHRPERAVAECYLLFHRTSHCCRF